MRKLTFASVILFLFAIPAFSQNFDPGPSAVQEKLENALKRYGTIERVYLNDKVKKTFEAKPGKEYYAWVVFKNSSTVVRRMMIIQLGPQGEKIKINYPKFNQAFSDAENQAFFIQVNAPEDTNTPTVLYKVDASPESTVYIYEATRGFKRD
jgi:hypothetical protein